jgi:hypothetical protein
MQINVDRLVRKFEEDPIPFLAASAGLLMGISKIVQAVGDSRGSHAYARDVNRRIRRERRQQRRDSK